MSFNFGGPVMVQTVPVDAVADRENRDIAQRGVENKYAAGAQVNVRDGSGATLSTVAATATGGRTDREYLERVDRRNDYEYVDYTTGVSVLSSAKSATFDVSKANKGLYPF